MTQTPNPNSRRRRLTADELIAILVAMTGIGAIFWWSLAHRPSSVTTVTNNVPGTVADSGSISQVFPLTGEAAGGKNRSAIVPNAAALNVTTPAPGVGTEQPVVKAPTVPEEAVTGAAVTGAVVAAGAAANLPAPVVAPSVTAALDVPPSTAPFTDVPDKYWGKDYIATLKDRGVLDDFGGGQFDPNAPITRGEYAKMLDRAFDRPVSQQVLEYQDIPANYPRKEALDKSVKMGFMTGYSKTKFAPNQQIPRYQMQISLAKGMGLKPPSNADAVLSKFSDASEMPSYAKEKMAAAIEAGFVVKDDQATRLQPVKNTTRGEAAALVYQALVKDGKIPASK